jgi:hypothetical protein
MLRRWIWMLVFASCGAASGAFTGSSLAQPVDVSWLPFGHADTPRGWYGERGVANPRNVPGPREGAVTWRGVDGRIWVFGGMGKGERGNAGFLDDLWSYDVALNTWTWMSGARVAEVVSDDIESSVTDALLPRRSPAPRFGGVGWTGTSGDLFLAGGVEWPRSQGHDGPPPVWRFDPIMQVWIRASFHDVLADVENRLISVQGMMSPPELDVLRGHLRNVRMGLEKSDVIDVLGEIVLLRTQLPGEPNSFLYRFMEPARIAVDVALTEVTYQMVPEHAPQVGDMMAMVQSIDDSDESVLEGNYPNPFSSSTTFRIRLHEPGHMSLIVYDMLGREVTRLSDGSATEGTFQYSWDGRDASGRQVPSGVYLYRLRTDSMDQSRLMTIVR